MVAVQRISYQLFESDFEGFSQTLGASLEQTGFAVLTNVNIDSGFLRRLKAALAELFCFKDSCLRQQLAPPAGMSGQRGYFGFEDECHPGSSAREQKAYFQYGADQNIWPEHRLNPEWVGEGVEWLGRSYFNRLTGILSNCLFAIANYTSVKKLPGLLDPTFKESWTIGRFLYYPAYTPAQLHRALPRSQLHLDSNLLTGLNWAPGLIVKTKQGEVIEVDGDDGDLVINSGMMLALLLGDALGDYERFMPTQHGVKAPTSDQNGERYTYPVFLHPHWDTPLPQHKEWNPDGLCAKDWLSWWVNRCQVG